MRFSRIFCVGHSLLMLALCAVQLADPERNGMALLPVVILDFPLSSILYEVLSYAPTSVYLVALFFVGGAWWFLLGRIVEKARASVGRAARENPFP